MSKLKKNQLEEICKKEYFRTIDECRKENDTKFLPLFIYGMNFITHLDAVMYGFDTETKDRLKTFLIPEMGPFLSSILHQLTNNKTGE